MCLTYRGKKYPTVKCGYCGGQMRVDDVDGRGSNAVIYYYCECGSWCKLRNGKVLSYGDECFDTKIKRPKTM